MSKGTVDVIIPVYHPGKKLNQLLYRLKKQTVVPKHIFLLQTLDEGGKLLTSKAEDITVCPIKKEDFDHGKTRDFGAKLSAADYILLMTQDALPESTHLIEELMKGFSRSDIAIAYARQIVPKDADEIEKLSRRYNYPGTSAIRTKKDIKIIGIKAFFCSDVCAMYDRARYEELGGFSYPAIFNEDMVMAYKALDAGYAIAYTADARVFHAHCYTNRQQFSRNFDIGVSHRMNQEIFLQVSVESEGAGFAKQTLRTLLKKGELKKAFDFCLQCFVRLAGYFLGKNYQRLPKRFVRVCSASPDFFKKKDG